MGDYETVYVIFCINTHNKSLSAFTRGGKWSMIKLETVEDKDYGIIER